MSLCLMLVVQDVSLQLLLQHHTCLAAAMLLTMMILESLSETVNKPLSKPFLL